MHKSTHLYNKLTLVLLRDSPTLSCQAYRKCKKKKEYISKKKMFHKLVSGMLCLAENKAFLSHWCFLIVLMCFITWSLSTVVAG